MDCTQVKDCQKSPYRHEFPGGPNGARQLIPGDRPCQKADLRGCGVGKSLGNGHVRLMGIGLAYPHHRRERSTLPDNSRERAKRGYFPQPRCRKWKFHQL